MNDLKTIILNLVYLAVILFYIYPLKFLFSLLISSWTGVNLFPKATENGEVVLEKADFPSLVITFSAGYFVIWMMLYIMHYRAGKASNELGLTDFEMAYTHKEKRGALWNSLIGLAAILMSFTGIEWLPGLCFLSIPIFLTLNERLFRKKISSQKAKR